MPEYFSQFKDLVERQIDLDDISVVSELINVYEYQMGKTLVIENDALYVTNNLSETEREKIMTI